MSNPFKSKEGFNKPLNKFAKEENIFRRADSKKSHQENQFQKPRNRNYRDKPRDYKNKNQFKSKFPAKQENQFEVKSEEFPELISSTKVKKESVNSYINRLNKVKQETEIKETPEKPGWTILSLNKKYKTVKTPEEISEYFNPTSAKLIWENRLKFREDLNDILGDRSPYWDMSQYEPDFDLNDYEYDENDDEDEEEEYVEDW